MWVPTQLVHRGGEEEQQLGVALRLPPLGQVGLGHRCTARVWLREQKGQKGEEEGHLGVSWPYPQQSLNCVYLLEEYARSIVRDLENSRIEGPIVGRSPGWTETTTEVAVLPFLDCASGLRYLAARMHMFLESRIDSARHEKSSCGSSGRKAIGREWMASWASLGARWQGHQGDSRTGNDLLSWHERALKYGAKAAAEVGASVTRSVTDPQSLTLVVTARGRKQFASLRTRDAMSEKVAAIRGACGCSEGDERGA